MLGWLKTLRCLIVGCQFKETLIEKFPNSTWTHYECPFCGEKYDMATIQMDFKIHQTGGDNETKD